MEFSIEETLIKSFYEPTFEGMKFIYVKLIEDYINDVIDYNNLSHKLKRYSDVNVGLKKNFNCFSDILSHYYYFKIAYNIFIGFKLKKKIDKKILKNIDNNLNTENELLEILQELMKEVISNDEFIEFLDCQNINVNKDGFVEIIKAVCDKFDIENDYLSFNKLLNGLETIYNGIEYNIICLSGLAKILNEVKSDRRFKEKLNSLNKGDTILTVLCDSLLNKFYKNDNKYLTDLLDIKQNFNLFDLLTRFDINVKKDNIINPKEVVNELSRIIKEINVKIKAYKVNNILEAEIKDRVIYVKKHAMSLHMPNIKFLDCENRNGITNEMLVNLLENNRMWFIIKLHRHYYSIAVEKVNGKINFFIFDASSMCFRSDYLYKVFGDIVKNKNINIYSNFEKLQTKGDCETWAIHFPFIIERLINFNYNEKLLSNLLIPNEKGIFSFKDNNLFKQILMLDEHMYYKKVNRVRNEFLYNYSNGTYISLDKRLVDLLQNDGLDHLSAYLLSKTNDYDTSDYIYSLAVNNINWLNNFNYVKYLEYTFKYECLNNNINVGNYICLYLNNKLDVYDLIERLYENGLLLFDETNEYFNIFFNLLLNDKTFDYVNLSVKFRNDFEGYILDNLYIDNEYNLQYLCILSKNNIINKNSIREGYKIRYNSELEDDLKKCSSQNLRSITEYFDIYEVRKYLLKNSTINNIIKNIKNKISVLDIWYFVDKLIGYSEGRTWLSDINNITDILNINNLELNVIEDFEIFVDSLSKIKRLEWLNNEQHIKWVLYNCKITNVNELEKFINILSNIKYVKKWFLNTDNINIIINSKTLTFKSINDFINFIGILYGIGYNYKWLYNNIHNIVANSNFNFSSVYEIIIFLKKLELFNYNINTLYDFKMFNKFFKNFTINTNDIKYDFKNFLNLLIQFGHKKIFIQNPKNFNEIFNVSNFIFYQNKNMVDKKIFEALTELWFDQKWVKEPKELIDIFINYKNEIKNIKHINLFLLAILDNNSMKYHITHNMFIQIISCVSCNNDISLKEIWEFLDILKNYKDTHINFDKWILNSDNLNKFLDNFIDYDSINNSCEYFYLILNKLIEYGYKNIWKEEPNRFNNFFINIFKFNNQFFINNYFSLYLLKSEFVKNWLLSNNNMELFINKLDEKRFFEINYNYFYNGVINDGLSRTISLISNLSVVFNTDYVVNSGIIDNILEKIELNPKHKDIYMNTVFQALPKCNVGLKWIDQNSDKIFNKYYRNNNFDDFSNFIVNLSKNNLLNSKKFKNYITLYFVDNYKDNEYNIKETINLLSNEIANFTKEKLTITKMAEFKKIFDNELNKITKDKHIYISLSNALIESDYINNFQKVLLEIKK